MIDKEQSKKLWAEVQENFKRLRACKGHVFEPFEWTENGLLLRRAKCQNCGGTIDVTDLSWYRQGIEHAGGDPRKVQTWDMDGPMPKRPK